MSAAPTEGLDEMVDGAGRIRPAWRNAFEQIQVLGDRRLAERVRLLERAAVEEGAAALLADRDAPSWRCDPVPVVLGSAEFGTVTRLLADRATLLEAMLGDLYGERSLLRDGIVPATLVFGSRHFIRPSEGRTRRRLSLYAADVVRAPDGRFRVVGDRCARPGGIGRALENRRLMRRVMPELFRAEIGGLDRFFERWRNVLRGGRPAGAAGDVVLLSEGHRDPAWFEQVLLARELGCDLVQGGDLTLREGSLHVKRLRGLQRVDLVLSRQDPHGLDPLELDWTAGTGIPGLLAAERAGRVAIWNDPGAALAGTPGLTAFLPAIGRHLLGRDVTKELPSAKTIGLGDVCAREKVLAEPERWTVRSAVDASAPPVALGALGRRGRDRLAEHLASAGASYVACERIEPSVAPCCARAELVPRPVSFRFFLLHDGERWVSLASAFVRVLVDGDAAGAPLGQGGLSKDLFVVPNGDDESEGEAVRSTEAERIELRLRPTPRRIEGDLPARVAGEFFVLGRELEQLDTAARLLRALATRLDRHGGRPRELVELRILAAALRRGELLPADALLDPAAPGLATALTELAGRESLLGVAVRRVARRIERLRDRITADMHGTLNRSLVAVLEAFADETVVEAIGGAGFDRLRHLTAAILGFTATLAGLVAETMTRGGSRLFLELGLRVERAETVVTELAAALGPAASLPGLAGHLDGPDLDAALELSLELRDSSITYRGRYPGPVEPGLVLDLLLADRQNPRGLAFQLAEAAESFRSLGEVGGLELLDRVDRLRREAERLVASVLDTDDVDRAASSLGGALGTLLAEIGTIGRAVARRYIDLVPAAMRTIGA